MKRYLLHGCYECTGSSRIWKARLGLLGIDMRIMPSGHQRTAPQAKVYSSGTILLVQRKLVTGSRFLLAHGCFNSCANYTTTCNSLSWRKWSWSLWLRTKKLGPFSRMSKEMKKQRIVLQPSSSRQPGKQAQKHKTVMMTSTLNHHQH